jgi:3-methyladenine DNA glycosylase AlkD
MHNAGRPVGEPVTGDIISAVRKELVQQADEHTRESFHRFFREGVTCYGVKTPAVRAIAKRYFGKIEQEGKNRIFSLCECLLQSDSCEEAFIALDWAYRMRGDYEPGDFPVFERWISRYVNNWAKCDTLCVHAVGSFLEQFPRFIEELKAWTRSPSRWFRRASAVSLILPARRGAFLSDILEIADLLLKDEDDLVQKGYGWMLKEAGRIHRKEVFEYIMMHKKEMPRTALRYAIEKMPEDLRHRAMERV